MNDRTPTLLRFERSECPLWLVHWKDSHSVVNVTQVDWCTMFWCNQWLCCSTIDIDLVEFQTDWRNSHESLLHIALLLCFDHRTKRFIRHFSDSSNKLDETEVWFKNKFHKKQPSLCKDISRHCTDHRDTLTMMDFVAESVGNEFRVSRRRVE